MKNAKKKKVEIEYIHTTYIHSTTYKAGLFSAVEDNISNTFGEIKTLNVFYDT